MTTTPEPSKTLVQRAPEVAGNWLRQILVFAIEGNMSIPGAKDAAATEDMAFAVADVDEQDAILSVAIPDTGHDPARVLPGWWLIFWQRFAQWLSGEKFPVADVHFPGVAAVPMPTASAPVPMRPTTGASATPSLMRCINISRNSEVTVVSFLNPVVSAFARLLAIVSVRTPSAIIPDAAE